MPSFQQHPLHRQSSLTLDLAVGTTASGMDLPPIAALFVIKFDIKAGYLIEWKKAAKGVDIDGVEYKSLPSGLHKLKEDLVYFVHQPFAGVAAFINAPAGENNRNSIMLSVGVLVPLSYGRLGRSWRHAQNLQEMASELIPKPDDYTTLENYFDLYHGSDELMEQHINNKSVPPSPSMTRSVSFQQTKSPQRMHMKHRSISDATALLLPGQSLSPHHPALSLPDFVLAFGPLIFPLYRAALMRKRILLVAEPPVEKACNFVYDISVLSNIPFAVADLISTDLPRLKPLFSVGVHDISTLELEVAQIKNRASGLPYNSNATDLNMNGELGSWVAVTTDSILSMKKDLYDILVTLPPPESDNAKEKVWPKIEDSATGEQIKATQRDLRRYRALKRSLRRYSSHTDHPFYEDDGDGDGGDDDDDDAASSIHEYDENDEIIRPLLDRRSSVISSRSIPQFRDIDSNSELEETVCEKLSWPQLAYESFIWWASAGEQRIVNGDGDSEGLEDRPGSEDRNSGYITPVAPGGQKPMFLAQQRRRSTGLSIGGMDGTGPLGNAEMDIIAYFHRMTSRIVGGMADIIDANGLSDDEIDLPNGDGLGYRDGEDEEEDKGVFVSPEDMVRLGLDQWSKNDEKFLKEVTRLWFKRHAMVERSGFMICGVKLC